MKLLLYCLLTLLWSVGQTHAQTFPLLNTSLTVGQSLPRPYTIVTSDGKTIDITVQNNQLFILNFMSVNCLSCIKALPDLHTLQKKWQGKFHLILVLSDTNEAVDKFKKKGSLGRLLDFPAVINDSTLKQKFPHTFISHEVWIKNGEVKAITGSEYVTDINIQKALSDPSFFLPIKQDKPDYDYNSSLLELKAGLNASPCYSVLLPYQSGVPRRYMEGIDSAKGIRWYRMINLSIIEMYGKSWNLPLHLPAGSLRLDMPDSSKLVFTKVEAYKKQWNMDNTFCYEAQFPVSYTDEQCREKIRTDFSFWFPYKAILVNKSPLQLKFTYKGTSTLQIP